MSKRSSIIRKTLVTGALVAGAGFGAASIASAATSSSSGSSSTGTGPATSATPPAVPHGTPPGDPATMGHGPNETLLTGTDLQKADAAATAAVPGATVIRAETDSSGASVYEVHMKKADGTYVTVELDKNFSVAKTVSGFGAGPAGQQPGDRMAPPNGAGAPPSSAAA